jgi:hypothetical protein
VLLVDAQVFIAPTHHRVERLLAGQGAAPACQQREAVVEPVP